MKKILYSSAFLFSTLFVAQTKKGIIIINEMTKKPLNLVQVYSEDQKFSKYTDENGYIALDKNDFDHKRLSISGIGFENETFDLDTLQIKNGVAYIYVNPKIASIEEVVIHNIPKDNIFQTISALDIHLRPINNSQEILRSVPGLFIGQHAGGGKAEQLFLRGFDIDHGTDVSITVDGLPVNMSSHAHGQGYADLHFIIPELIENVNFNKGPYFADKGNFTTAGFVEFKTKDYLDTNFAKV